MSFASFLFHLHLSRKCQRRRREFYVPKQEHERNLYGSEFEVKLRNEMTQKAVANECADYNIFNEFLENASEDVLPNYPDVLIQKLDFRSNF